MNYVSIRADITPTTWDEPLVKSALCALLHLITLDAQLLEPLAAIFARATHDIKRWMARLVEVPVKTLKQPASGNEAAIIALVRACPEGAEPLICRVVSLLTQRSELMYSVSLFDTYLTMRRCSI